MTAQSFQCEASVEQRMGSNNGKPVLREEDITALSKSSGLNAMLDLG